MKNSRETLRLLTATILLFIAGCAPAYHSYSGCRVNCRYCPLGPLAYPHYCNNQCHASAASKYLVADYSTVGPPLVQEEVGEEVPSHEDEVR